MHDLDGGVGGVYALAAGAGGAADFDADFVGLEFEVHFFGFWEDGDGGRGGVDAALGLGGGDTLDAVDAALVTEAAEDFVAADFHDDFLEAADIGRAGFEGFDLPAAGFGEAGVHADEIGGEEGGFVAACACTDFEEGIAALKGVAGEDGDLDDVFELGEAALDDVYLGGGQGLKFGITAGGHLAAVGEFGDLFLVEVPVFQEGVELAMFAGEFTGFFGVVKEAGVSHEILEELEAGALGADDGRVVHEMKMAVPH